MSVVKDFWRNISTALSIKKKPAEPKAAESFQPPEHIPPINTAMFYKANRELDLQTLRKPVQQEEQKFKAPPVNEVYLNSVMTGMSIKARFENLTSSNNNNNMQPG